MDPDNAMKGLEEGEEGSSWAGAAPPLRNGLAPGSPIVLTGIASKPELNGRKGWSLGLHPETGRCVVHSRFFNPGRVGAW